MEHNSKSKISKLLKDKFTEGFHIFSLRECVRSVSASHHPSLPMSLLHSFLANYLYSIRRVFILLENATTVLVSFRATAPPPLQQCLSSVTVSRYRTAYQKRKAEKERKLLPLTQGGMNGPNNMSNKTTEDNSYIKHPASPTAPKGP